ncbi:hypothetical protein BDZ89DRAFT_1145349 [Hymenopellis radicata]|nr:hypothetical protein BDZ89DRAFT_1145349 [Hymenopellis radicata]
MLDGTTRRPSGDRCVLRQTTVIVASLSKDWQLWDSKFTGQLLRGYSRASVTEAVKDTMVIEQLETRSRTKDCYVVNEIWSNVGLMLEEERNVVMEYVNRCCPSLWQAYQSHRPRSQHNSITTISSIIQRLMMGRQATGMRPGALQVSLNALPTVPSTLEHLLSSNDPPSDVEIQLLHELHALFSTRLTRLDDEIALLLSSPDCEKTHALEQLEDDRAVLQNRSRQVSGALSTIRFFPKEVLQEIFLRLIPDAGFMVLDATQGAWAASRVCSSWRSASRYPHLWTTFRITSGGCGCIRGGGFGHRCPTFVRYKNPIAILQTALLYSGSYKLDLHVEIQFNDCVGNRSRIHSLLDVLMSTRPKLRQVSVENALLRLNYVLLTSFTSEFSVYFPCPIPPLFVIRRCVDLVYMEANLVGPMDDDDLQVETVEPSISNTSLTHLTINDPTLLAYLSLPALLSLTLET